MALNKSVLETKPSARSAVEIKQLLFEINKTLSKKFNHLVICQIGYKKLMISLDKIAKKNKLIDSKGTIKKPWEKKEHIDQTD